MGNDARRKQRQRMKRQEKKATYRRMHSGSPYKKLATPGQYRACYINSDWQEQGIASIHVLKQLPGGGLALGVFLVDLFCVGLKDAWGRINITMSDFDDSIIRLPDRVELIRIDPSLAQRLVLGGVRFARQNGFRLPPRYERWVSMLGSLSACETADLSGFGTEDGKLRYIGTMEDLKKRLIGCSAEEFLARNHAEFILPVAYGDDPDMVEEDQALEEVADELRMRMLNSARQWCFAKGIQPHARLDAAVDLTIESLFQINSPNFDDPTDEEVASEASDKMNEMLSMADPCDAALLNEALGQLHEYMTQFSSSAELLTSLGLSPEDEE